MREPRTARILDSDGPGAADPDGTATIAHRLVSNLFAAAPARVPCLEQVSGSGHLAFRAPDRAYVVGSAPDCDLLLLTDQVSWEHAAFTRRIGGVFVRDLDSKNGVRVAGARIASEVRLRDGDIVEVGPVALRLDDPEDRYLRAIETRADRAHTEPAERTREAVRVPGWLARISTIVAATILITTLAAAVALAPASCAPTRGAEAPPAPAENQP
jgi:hypothetical protein